LRGKLPGATENDIPRPGQVCAQTKTTDPSGFGDQSQADCVQVMAGTAGISTIIQGRQIMPAESGSDPRKQLELGLGLAGTTLSFMGIYLSAFAADVSKFLQQVIITTCMGMLIAIVIWLIIRLTKANDAIVNKSVEIERQLTVTRELEAKSRQRDAESAQLVATADKKVKLLNDFFRGTAANRVRISQSLAGYSALERGVSRNFLDEGKVRLVIDELAEARAGVHNLRMISLTEACNSIAALLTRMKSVEICVNLKLIVWDALKDPQSRKATTSGALGPATICKYMTIARSDNTSPDRQRFHVDGTGNFKAYDLEKNLPLWTLLNDPSKGHVLIQDVSRYVEDSPSWPRYDWPNKRSSRFFASQLIVPLWHNLREEFASHDLYTVLWQSGFRTLRIERDGIDLTCYGFLTADAIEAGAFDDLADPVLLSACALQMFSELFEHFAIQYAFPITGTPKKRAHTTA
jgi:hypothetical protein